MMRWAVPVGIATTVAGVGIWAYSAGYLGGGSTAEPTADGTNPAATATAEGTTSAGPGAVTPTAHAATPRPIPLEPEAPPPVAATAPPPFELRPPEPAAPSLAPPSGAELRLVAPPQTEILPVAGELPDSNPAAALAPPAAPAEGPQEAPAFAPPGGEIPSAESLNGPPAGVGSAPPSDLGAAPQPLAPPVAAPQPLAPPQPLGPAVQPLTPPTGISEYPASPMLPAGPPGGGYEPQPPAAAPYGPAAPTLTPPPESAPALGGGPPSGEFRSPAGSPSAAALSAAGAGTPGAKELEGAQVPSLTIEKIAPPEIQVSKPATFEVRVRNSGRVTAYNVVLRDEVPRGTRLIETAPAISPDAGGQLLWSFPRLDPGEEQVVQIRLMPEAEGEIGSLATVSFQAQASVRTVCTRPVLALEHTAPAKILAGENVLLKIRITNTGTGAASGVVIQEDVPEGLTHPAGSQLEYEVGTLKPGESRELELALRAAQAGIVQNVVSARAEAAVPVEHRAQIEVIAPLLKVAIDGPRKRLLDRPATYKFEVANPGTASAREVDLVVYLPKGFQFSSTNNAGLYDPQTHAVHWSLAELPPDKKGTVELIAIPTEMGEHKIRVEGKAQMGLTDVQEQPVVVEGIAALNFEVVDLADPIEVGQESTYEIRVVNQGSKIATDVRVTATLPAGMKPLGGEGPAQATVQGQTLVFEALPRLAPKAEALFKIRATGEQPGDHRITVQVINSDLESPVTKQESTRVYADR